jgi:two-component system KDP operon response regulator KdpE
MDTQKILVVDDEPKLVRLIQEVLTASGYQVLAARSGRRAIEMTALEQPDLVILDIMLLGEIDGNQVASRIREFSDVPIIMLTAKVRETDVLRGFDMGADDYIKKPFSSKELLARIRALLNRAKVQQLLPNQGEIICGDVKINLLRRKVLIGERDIHLTPTEYKLLHELAVHCNQAMNHEQLLSAVWGAEYIDDFDYLRSYIHLLRRKLEVDPANPQLIVRVPGFGYMLETKELLP